MKYCVMAVLVLAARALAQDFCFPDANDDSHPRFGHTSVRVVPESENGWSFLQGNSGPTTFDLADLNHDGHLDAVVGDVLATHAILGKRGFVSILWGTGDGVFTPGPIVEVGLGPCHVLARDLNIDGEIDLIIADEVADGVVAMIHLGEGVFAPPVTYAAGDMPRSLACEDFDADGDVDVMALNTQSSDVSFLRNRGDGTFEAQVTYAVPGVTGRGDPNLNFRVPGPFVASGDFDGDGSMDLAVPCGSKIRFLLNDKQGAFSLSNVTCALSIPSAYALVAEDLDGNGWTDVAATSYHGVGVTCLMVYLNRGPMQFDPEVGYDAAWITSATSIQNPTALAAGDIDNDADVDLVVCHRIAGERMILLRNLGDGSYAPKEYVQARQATWFARFADLNHDAHQELVSLTYTSRTTLNALLGSPEIHETNYKRYPKVKEACCLGLESLAAADLDLDGDVDLVAAMSNPEHPYHVATLMNDGFGEFDEIIEYSLGPTGTVAGKYIVAGDLDGDRWPDLVTATVIPPNFTTTPGSLALMINVGDGTFENGGVIDLDPYLPRSLRLADIEHDGDLDIIALTHEPYPGNKHYVQILQNSDNTYAIASTVLVGEYASLDSKGDVEVTDIDGDGDLDLVTICGSTTSVGHLRVHLASGQSLQFVLAGSMELPSWPLSVTVSNIDDDSSPDILVAVSNWAHPGNPTLIRAAFDSTGFSVIGAWGSERQLTRRPHTTARTGTGWTVVQETQVQATSWAMSASTPPEPASFVSESSPAATALADFNNDGEVDLAVATGSSTSSVNVYLARPCANCIPDCDADADLDVMDYLCFLDRFAARDPRADLEHDGDFDAFDLLAFQGLFAQGCE